MKRSLTIVESEVLYLLVFIRISLVVPLDSKLFILVKHCFSDDNLILVCNDDNLFVVHSDSILNLTIFYGTPAQF